MKKSFISEEEKQSILESHTKAGYKSSILSEQKVKDFEIVEKKMESVEDLEKEIEELEKKIEELKSKKNEKTETKEGEFDDLVNADIDVEDERDSLEQA